MEPKNFSMQILRVDEYKDKMELAQQIAYLSQRGYYFTYFYADGPKLAYSQDKGITRESAIRLYEVGLESSMDN